MGILSFWKLKKPENDLFSQCDFQFAKNELISAFSHSVIPKKLASLLDGFIGNPCRETARPLIQYNSNFAIIFQHNKGRKELCEALGIDTSHPTKTAAMLKHEAEFEEYCNSIADDIKRHRELKVLLRSKGYSDEVINEAFSQYWSDLATDI